MRLFLCLFYCLSALGIYAQPNQSTPYVHLTTKNGLSNNFVNTIVQDSTGFIWIGTQDGLSRFDGEYFETYKNFPSNNIIALYLGQKDTLWVGTTQGLLKFNRKTGDRTVIKSFENQPVKVLSADPDQNYWAVTSTNVYHKTSQSSNWEVSVQGLQDEHSTWKPHVIFYARDSARQNTNTFILSSAEIGSGQNSLFGIHVWNKTLLRWDWQLSTQFPIIDLTSDGELLLARRKRDENAIHEVNPKAQVHIKVLQSPEINAKSISRTKPTIDFGEYFYSAWRHSLLKVNRQSMEIEQTWKNTDFGLSDTFYPVRGLFKDGQNNIWLYTEGDGVVIAPEKDISSIRRYRFNETDQGLSAPSVRAIYQAEDYGLWVGGYHPTDKDVNVYLPSGEKKHLKIASIPMRIVAAEAPYLWLITQEGELYKVNGQTRETVQYVKMNRPGRDLLYQDSSTLWALLEDGLVRFNPKTEQKEQVLVKNTTTLAFASPAKDQLWVGTKQEGLLLLNTATGELMKQYSRKGKGTSTLRDNHIKVIHISRKDSTLWVGTPRGLHRFDRQTAGFKHYTTENGLPDAMIYGILEDETGKLWLSTNRGIAKFDPVEETFTNFTTADGLQDDEYNTYAYFRNPKTGELFFGGIKGVDRFFPKDLTKNVRKPNMVLTGYERLGKPVPLDIPVEELREIELPESEAQMLSFHFAALDFTNASENQYAYRLKGTNPSWLSLGTENKLTLNNLRAGTYLLQLRGSNNHGVWTAKPLEIKLTIRPPFYRTPLFLMLLLCVLLFVGYSFYRLRARQAADRERVLRQEVVLRTQEIAEKNEELQTLVQTKDHLFAIISHDLRSPLVAFETISEQLDYYVEQNELAEIQALSKDVGQSAKQLSRMLDNLLNWSLIQKNLSSFHPETLSLETLFDETIRIYESTARLYKTQLKKEITANSTVYADENMLLTILRNLVNNALKFTPSGGTITLRAYRKAEKVCLEVQDTGVGISEEARKKLFEAYEPRRSKGLRGEKGTGLGFVLVREFVGQHGGEITVESTLGEGTCIRIYFCASKVTL